MTADTEHSQQQQGALRQGSIDFLEMEFIIGLLRYKL